LPYRLLADAVLVTHAAFVAFVMLGGLLAWRRPWLAWLHLPVVAWGAGIELTGGICPLTPLENWLRSLAGLQGYPGGFIEHYLLALLYPDGLTRNVQLALGLMVLAVNVAIYAEAWRRLRCRPA
jgi:uncharacterized membrane protein (DUF485 family)